MNKEQLVEEVEELTAKLNEDLNKTESNRIEGRIRKLTRAIAKIEDKEERKTQIATSVSTILNNDELVWVTSTQCWWIQMPDMRWVPQTDRSLKNTFTPLLDNDCFKNFHLECDAKGVKYKDATSSFTKQPAHVFNMLSDFKWIQMHDDPDDKPHVIFDLLLKSLGGGVQANWEHIEKVIWSKYLHPENYLLPCLTIYGAGGNVGKNLFVEAVLTEIFGRIQVGKPTMEQLTGTFNDIIIGKAILFIDETVEDKVNHEKLKSILHTPTIDINMKYANPFKVDNTALYIIASNNTLGGVRLTGEKTDRRFSTIYANTPLNEHIAEEMDISDTEATTWLITEGQHILRDHDEISKWLRQLYEKYGDVTQVEALHEGDHEHLLDLQKPLWEILCESLFIHDHVDYIKMGTLYELYKHFQKETNPRGGMFNNKTFFAKVDNWFKRSKLPYERRSIRWGGNQVRTYGNMNGITGDDNDRNFIEHIVVNERDAVKVVYEMTE